MRFADIGDNCDIRLQHFCAPGNVIREGSTAFLHIHFVFRLQLLNQPQNIDPIIGIIERCAGVRVIAGGQNLVYHLGGSRFAGGAR